jgi:hypothetical protein
MLIDIIYSSSDFSPYHTIIRGIGQYNTFDNTIVFLDSNWDRLLEVVFQTPRNLSAPPRSISTWISGQEDLITTSCAKLIRDVLPEAFGKLFTFKHPNFYNRDYYITNNTYVNTLY